MTTAELTELKRRLRQLLPDEGISAVIRALKEALPEVAPKFSTVFQLETRLNMANRDKIRGVLSQEQLELAYNRISADLIEFVDNLQEVDFAAGGAAAKSGSILYKIPQTMQVDRETRCVIRLAFEEEVIIQNIELTGVVLKPVRVSEVMEVVLIDPNDDPAFDIREVNSAEQFLEKGDYTEWLFYVTPLRVGQYPLAVRVSVVEVVAGKDRKKEIVLEETIKVVAEPDDDGYLETTTFQNSGYTFTYATESGEPALPPAAPAPQAMPPAKSGNNRRIGTAILALLLVAGGIWALGPGIRDYFAWRNATDEHSRSAYESYISAHPNGRHRLEAELIIDRMDWTETTSTPADTTAYLRYLEIHPAGLFHAEALRILDSLRRTGSESSHFMPRLDTTAVVEHQEPLLPSAADPSKPDPSKKRPPQSKSRPAAPAPVKPPAPVSGSPAPPIEAPNTEKPNPNRRSGFEMISVAGGTFTMGSVKGEKDECPHEVAVKSFKIGKYEVTQADWKEIMGKNPAFYSGCDECPVENVSWNDVQAFIQKASAIRGVRYRLPTEAEWEYAARGGLRSQAFTYSGFNRLGSVGWYHGNTERPNRVGRKKPNELGIHDMSGNVWEWCQDTYQPYPGCKGKASSDRVLRGGGWRNYEDVCRAANRNQENPGKRDYQNGFRLARD